MNWSIKLAAVVTLNVLHSGAKLSTHKGEKVSQSRKGVRFEAQGQHPLIMREFIKNEQIIFVSRDPGNRRRPQIAVNKIKIARCSRNG